MSRIPEDAAVFSMAVAEEMTGLTRRRIRYYEKMGLLEPARTKGNRRLYSPADIQRLRDIKRLLDEGLDLRGIGAVLAQGRGEAARPGVAMSSLFPSGRASPEQRLERYEDARARLLGRGPSGSLDRLNPGDAARLSGGGHPRPTPAGKVREPGRSARPSGVERKE